MLLKIRIYFCSCEVHPASERIGSHFTTGQMGKKFFSENIAIGSIWKRRCHCKCFAIQWKFVKMVDLVSATAKVSFSLFLRRLASSKLKRNCKKEENCNEKVVNEKWGSERNGSNIIAVTLASIIQIYLTAGTYIDSRCFPHWLHL